MKLDNPSLTAYAVGELTPADQAEVEQLIRSDREIAVEVEETCEMVRILRENLAAEPCGALADHQRDAIFREASIARMASAPASERDAFTPVVIPRAAWWNRPGPWQAIAACAVAGLASYALFVNVGGPQKMNALTDSGDIVIRVPADGTGQTGEISGMELTSPSISPGGNGVAQAGPDPLKTLRTVPKLNGNPPTVEIESTSPSLPAVARSGDSESTETSAPTGDRKGRPRVIVSAGKNQELANNLAAASVARRTTDAEVEKYLGDRLKEAGELREGTTYREFSRYFRPAQDGSGKYEMNRMPRIKVDAEFVSAEGQPLSAPPSPDSRLKNKLQPFLQ